MAAVSAGSVSGVIAAVYGRIEMSARKEWVWEVRILGSVWPKAGGCGEIMECDRRTWNTTQLVLQGLTEAIQQLIQKELPPDAKLPELKNLPVKIHFDITIEKKEVIRYGS
jgi:hypothetical protein